MDKPFFSIVIPVHNSESYVEKSLNSIINQTFQNFEVLIIDDSSSDNTVKVIERKIDNLNNFKLIKLSNNLGVAAARNVGIKSARGKYICFLDDDDMWLKEKLQVQYNYITKKKLDWVFSNYEVLNENYRHIGTRFRIPGMYDYEKMLRHGNPIGMLTVAVKSNLLKNNLFKDVGHEDYDLWLRLAKKGNKGYLIRDVLAQYLKRDGSRSSNKIKSIVWTYNCFRRNGCSMSKSFLLIFGYAMNVVSRKTD